MRLAFPLARLTPLRSAHPPFRYAPQAGSPAGVWFHVLCCLSYTLLCLGWNLWAGRDQSWDQLNYHLYVALAWWENRLPDEFFAASAQGYLNPLPHLPFFAAFSTGWPSLAISSLMAVLHSINLWLLHFIGVELTPPVDRLRRLMVFGGVLLGGLTPAFLIETGGSFTDVIVSIPSLAALLSLFYWQRHKTRAASGMAWTGVYLAGLLAGFATGLKPSALVFAAALGFAALLVAGRDRVWALSWRGIASGLTGFLLGGGAHALMLWRAFGNPVFPLFNGVFHSPWFVDANLVSGRFRPASLLEALRYPLDLADAFKRVGFESIAVDIRPLSLLVVIGLAWVLRSRKGTNSPAAPDASLCWLTLAAFFPLWLYTSGNTRYGIQGFLLLGPALAWAAASLRGRRALWPLLALGLPLAAQGIAAFTLNIMRWSERPWSPSWFELEIPRELRSRPAYYLSLQTQTYAALATVLAPGSRFTNLIGQNTLPSTGPAWLRIRQEQQAQGLPWRSLHAVPMLLAPGGVPLDTLATQDAMLSEYGLKTDPDDCAWIVLDGKGEPPLHWARNEAGATYISEVRRNVILSCALLPAPPLDSQEALRRKALDARMNRWEQQCPDFFAPAHTQSEQLVKQRRRIYVNTDTMLMEANGHLNGLLLSGDNWVRLEDQQGRPLIAGCPEKRPQGKNEVTERHPH